MGGSLKEEFFQSACEEQKSIRFISRGRVLKDSELIDQCGLGDEAHIHASINERSNKTTGVHEPRTPVANLPDARDRSSAPCEVQDGSGLGMVQLLCAVTIAGAGIILRVAWQKRWHLSMHASQMICIFASCWAYVVLFHGLPALLQLIRFGFRTASRTGTAGVASAPSS